MGEREQLAEMVAGGVPAQFAKGVLRSRSALSICVYHGEVLLTNEAGVPTTGPDGCCPVCRDAMSRPGHVSCPDHGIQPTDKITNGCPICALEGDPDSVAARARYDPPSQSEVESTVREVIASITLPGVEEDGPHRDDEPRQDLSPAQVEESAPRNARGDRQSSDRQRPQVPGTGGAGIALSDDDLLIRVGQLMVAVRDGTATPEDLIALGQYRKDARAKGLMK